MNKHLQRIISTAARGQRMVVQKTAASAGMANGATNGRAGATDAAVPAPVFARLTLLSFAALLAVGATLQWVPVAQAQIVVDPNAPRSQQATVLNTANGLPQVNIQTPSAGGVSRNTFTQFDIQSQGAILNNSRTNVQTQLGGFIQGNPSLAGGSARIILNEINSTNPTQLRGFVEVAGQRAEVIIANPAGVNVNGGGFINASRATITTGTPVINGGNLEGFVVQKGLITISGAGLDSSQTDFTGLMARAIEVNAGIWAKELKLTAGANQVNADQSVATAAPGTALGAAPAFGIDTSQLGGMYAGKITLVGTEAGLGVRNAGTLAATAGNIAISADGLLTNTATGRMTSSGDTSIAARSLNNDGQISAGGRTGITLADTLTNSGTIAGQQTSLQAAVINNLATGRLEGSTLDVSASQSLSNAGRIVATGQLNVSSTGTLTNQGKLAGQQATVQAATLNNQGSGRIEADTLDITAQTVNNTSGIAGNTVTVNAGTLNNQGASALVAGTAQVNLYVRDALNNTGGATVYSLGGLNIAANSTRDADGTLLNRTTLVNNNTSLLQADGDMQIAAETLNNTRAAPQITSTTSSTSATLLKRNGYWMCEYGNYIDSFAGFCAANYADMSWYDPAVHINPLAEKPGMFIGGWMVETERYTTTTVTNEQLAGALQAEPKILAGNNLILKNVGNLRNEYGSITAGQNVTIGNADPLGSYQTASVTNIGAVLNRNTVVDEYSVFRWNRNYGAATSQSVAPQASTAVLSRVGGTMSAGGTFSINATTVTNTNALPGQSSVAGPASPGPAGAAFSLPALGALVIPPLTGPGQRYLIESDPRFTSYRQWLSSDYMLSALNTDPTLIQKRLGDGFYEQKLIRDQVSQLTGRRFLDGYASDEAQYQALMASGVTVAQQWNLRPGIALTAAQISQLTSDIVWLVEQTVTLSDGSTTQAWVPVVYLSQTHTADLHPTGALISGKSVSIIAKGDLSNRGALQAQDSILLAANKVTNELGLIDASRGSTAIVSDTDIINRSGMISGNSVQLNAGRDIQIDAVTRQFSASRQTVAGNVSGSNTEVGPQGSVVSRGDMLINASRDIKLAGALVSAQGSASLIAGANLVVDTLQTQQSTQDVSGMGVRRTQGTTNLGSTLQAGGNLALSSGADTTLRGAQIGAGQDLSVISGGNLNIVAATDTTQLDENMRAKGYVRNDHTAQERVVGSSLLAGGNVTLAALQTAPDGSKGNITVQGSSVSAVTGQLTVVAANNVNIVEAREKGEYDLFNETKGSKLFSSKSQTGHDTGRSDIAVGSSLSGNAVSITAGNDLTVRGSSVAGNGQTTLAAVNNVTIESAASSVSQSTFYEEKKSGFSGSLMGGINYGKSSQEQSQAQQQVIQVGSSISGANVAIAAGRDATVSASAVLADRDVTISAGRNINVLAATNVENSQSDAHSSSSSIGITPGLGGRYTAYGKTSALQDADGSRNTSATSLISANGGNLTLTAGTDAQYNNTGQGNITSQGADLLAKDTVKLTANQVDLQAANGSTSSQFHAESKSVTLGAQLTGVVGSQITRVAEMANQATQTDNSRLQGAAALKAGYDAYKLAGMTGKQVDQINAAAADAAKKNGGPGDPGSSAFGISVTLGTSKSSQDSRQSSTEQRGTNIQATNIEIKSREGDISMTGAKLQANDIVLDAAKNLNLLAAQNTAQLQSQNSASSAGVGVTFGFGEQSGISFQIGANNAKGKGNGSETTYDNTQVTATNNLTLKSGNDTNLIGAQAAGKTVTADVGGQLNIQSLQDSSNYESKQTTGGFGLSLCIPPFCYGTPVTGNVSASKQQIDHNYQSTTGQSGIAAGTGGFDIKVAGATDLKGAAITSEADKSKNSLSTSALTYSDLNNQQNTSASSSSVSVGYGGGSMASTLANNVTSNLLGNAQNGTGLPKSGSESSVTQSVISPAQVTITGGDKQSEDNVAALTSRDASTANGALKNTMTLQQAQELQAQQRKAQENAAAAQYIGSVLTNVIGDMGVKYGWADGSNEKTVLHGLAGLIQAKVAGTNSLSGAAVGALNEKLLPELENYLVAQGYPKGSAEFNALLTAGSTLAGAAIGAGAGASIAYTGTVNNYLKHAELVGLKKDIDSCKIKKCSDTEYQKIISGYIQVSDANNASLAACNTQSCLDEHAKWISEAKPFADDVLRAIDNGQPGVGVLSAMQKTANLLDIQQKKVITYQSEAKEFEQYKKIKCATGSFESCLKNYTDLKTGTIREIKDVKDSSGEFWADIAFDPDQSASKKFLSIVGSSLVSLMPANTAEIALLVGPSLLGKIKPVGEFPIAADMSGLALQIKPNGVKVFNGVELNPALPPPAAGYAYAPGFVKGAQTENAAYAHMAGYQGEVRLANEVAGQGQAVVKWGDKIGAQGNDIISVNSMTGEVVLWDNKFRSASTGITQSPTFANAGTRAAAVQEATLAIERSNLPESVRARALQNIAEQNFTTNTVGSGSARNSVQVRYCGNKPC